MLWSTLRLRIFQTRISLVLKEEERSIKSSIFQINLPVNFFFYNETCCLVIQILQEHLIGNE